MAGYSVTINAVDNATGVINRVNTGLEHMGRRAAAAQAPFGRFNRALGQLAQNTGVSRLASDVSGLGQRLSGVAGDLGRFAPALGAITGAASIAGVAQLVEKWTAFGSRLRLDADRINTTAQQLHGLQGAATLAGSSAEALTSGMRTLGDNLVNAAGGRDAHLVGMLSQLGIAFLDTGGKARKATAVLPELANKIASLANPSQRAMVATAAFGAAGESLLPFLTRGATGIADYTAAAERYGLINDRGVAAANALRLEQAKLGLAFEGLGYSVSERVAPILLPMLNRLSEWTAAHRGEIAGFIERVAQGFEQWTSSGGLDRFISRVENVGNSIGTMVKGVQNFGKITREAFDTGIEKLEQFYAWLQRITGWGPPSWMRRILGIDDAARPPAIPDPQAGMLNGRLTSSLPPEMRRLLQPPMGAPPQPGTYEFSTPRERLRAGIALGPSAPMPAPAEQEARGRQAHDFLVARGWSSAQAAGIVANLQKESGFNPGAVGDGGAAYGLAQWHPDRRAAIERGTGRSLVGADFEGQMEALDWELRNTEKRAGDALRNATTAAQAGSIVSRLYERPAAADAEAADRGANAARWGVRLGMPTAPVPAAAPPVAPVPTASSSGAQAQQVGPDGRVTVRIEHANPPEGTRLRTTMVGTGLRIEQPMLGALP